MSLYNIELVKNADEMVVIKGKKLTCEWNNKGIEVWSKKDVARYNCGKCNHKLYAPKWRCKEKGCKCFDCGRQEKQKEV